MIGSPGAMLEVQQSKLPSWNGGQFLAQAVIFPCKQTVALYLSSMHALFQEGNNHKLVLLLGHNGSTFFGDRLI